MSSESSQSVNTSPSPASSGSTEFVKITEGLANMNYNKDEAVFYNKVQVFNRDISIQTIRLFAKICQDERNEKYQAKLIKYERHKESAERAPFPPKEGISVLDALAATGLRSVRYLKEIPGVRHVTINDLDPKAVQVALENCKANDVDESRVTIHHGDAALFMYQHREPLQQFDVIDLDPYGTASPFLDSTVQAVADGGLLCVTCTDMPTLAGNYPEVCFAKYGVVPLKAKYMHEMSLRILLHAIDSAANRYKRHIVPWLCISVDFYVRVFVRVYESPAEVKKSSLKRIMVHQSNNCPSYYVQPLAQIKKTNLSAAHVTAPNICPETQGNMRVGGPFWGDAIHSQPIVDELLRRLYAPVGSIDLPYSVPTIPRVKGILTSICEELKDVPFFYTLPDLAQAVKTVTPLSADFRSALLNAGYRVSQFHNEAQAVKTDAPPHVVWDVMRAYCKLHPKVTSNSAAAAAVVNNDVISRGTANTATIAADLSDTSMKPVIADVVETSSSSSNSTNADHNKVNVTKESNKRLREEGNKQTSSINSNNNNNVMETANDDEEMQIQQSFHSNQIPRKQQHLLKSTSGPVILNNPITTPNIRFTFHQSLRPKPFVYTTTAATTVTSAASTNTLSSSSSTSITSEESEIISNTTTNSAAKTVFKNNKNLPPSQRAVRYAPNPEPYWGPKRRAGRSPLRDANESSTTSSSSSSTNSGDSSASGTAGVQASESSASENVDINK